MRLTRFLPFFVYAAALCAVQSASAQNYPNKPIRAIIGFPPGGGVDVVARLMTPSLDELLGQQLIVENHPGAAANIGADIAAKAPADGYTVFFTTPSITVNPALYPSITYDPVRDFAAVSPIGTTPLVLVVQPSMNVRNAKELFDLAKASPGKLTYSSGGNGSVAHLTGELLKSMTGLNITHIPYKGSPELLLAVMRGETNLTFGVLPSTMTFIKEGKLKALAVTSLKRSQLAPEIPTLAETVPGYESIQWYGVMVPAKTPVAIVDKLNAAIIKSTGIPDVKSKLNSNGLEIYTSTPAQFSAFIKSELVKWSKVVKDSNMKID